MAGSCHAPHMGPSRGHLATSRLGPALRYLALPPASSEWFPLWIQTSCFLWRRQLRAAGFFQKVKVHLVSVSWQVRNIRKVLRKINKPFGLYPNFLSPVSGNWMQREYRDGTALPLTAASVLCEAPGARQEGHVYQQASQAFAPCSWAPPALLGIVGSSLLSCCVGCVTGVVAAPSRGLPSAAPEHSLSPGSHLLGRH